MKETRTINLNGLVFHIDNDAYVALSGYLQDIELRLPADEKQEVMADIEARIAELLQSALFAKNQQVINIEMVKAVQGRIGSPADFGENKRPKVKHQANNQGCGRALRIALTIFLVICALPVLFVLFIIIFAVMMGLFGASIGVASAFPLIGMDLFGSGWLTAAAILCLILAIGIPIVMIISTIVSYMRTRHAPKARFWWISLILWVLSLVGIGALATQAANNHGGIVSLIETMQQLDDDYDWDDSDDTPMQAEQRTVEPFTDIDIRGCAAIHLIPSNDYQLSLRSNSPADVATSVRDGVLYIEVANNRYTKAKMEISVPALSAIRTAGACKITCDMPLVVDSLLLDIAGATQADLNLQARSLTIDSKGASELDLTGTAEQAVIRLSGAGSIDAEHLVVQDMHINCAGASEAELNVQRNLWAQAAGASKITYEGNPAVKQSMAVGGSVIKRD